MPAGTSVAKRGRWATLQAPVARTTVGALQLPSLVVTAYPFDAGRSWVTVVPVCTGAATTAAYRSRNEMTSGIVMKPSGSSPS